MSPSIDWSFALATGRALVRVGPIPAPEQAHLLVTELRTLASAAMEYVQDAAVLEPVGPQAQAGTVVRVVDRHDWMLTNIDGLSRVVGPLFSDVSRSSGSFFGRLGAKSMGGQVGIALAYVAGRVLGQYDFLSGRGANAEAGKLLLVAPNILHTEQALAVSPQDFRLWVCAHEATHWLQFTATPWLREYFLSQIADFIKADEEDQVPLSRRIGAMFRDRDDTDAGSDDGVLVSMVNPSQRAIVHRLTALMTLLEGHADYVMDVVGKKLLPSAGTLRRRFDARRVAGGPFASILRRFLGVEAKIRQYTEGRKFVASIVENAGMEKLNAVWSSPEALPDRQELKEPSRWLARVGV